MTYVSCSVPERFVNPLFEVFDGGDFILSSYRDIEEDKTHMRIFFEDASQADDARKCLQDALDLVGVSAAIERGELADEDWQLAYRRHFKTERVSPRIWTVPEWEWAATVRAPDQVYLKLDPGMAFGTGKHETTKACLGFIDELAAKLLGSGGAAASSLLDMGCGSGILSIAAKKLGFARVAGFDVDQAAVEAALENAERNAVQLPFVKFALGRTAAPAPTAFTEGPLEYEVVVANILGPLLVRFADEIVSYVGRYLVISGILASLYPEVLAAYTSRGFREVAQRTLGEWTTGLLTRER